MTVRARTATVLSHARPAQTRRGAARADRGRRARGRAAALRRRGDAQVRPRRRATASSSTRRSATTSSCASSLGGDGTILRALRRYAGTSVPVFAVNYGEVGFLATIDPEEDGDLTEAFERALAGDFEVLTLPALALETPEGPQAAINDVSIHRRAGERVAELAYAIDGEEAGSVRCDGLVLVHAGRLDGLQPRQRRPGAGVGRGGLRRVVHRAALADRAGARGRAERPAVGAQPLAGRGRHLARRAPGRRCSARATRSPRRSCARRPTWRRCPGRRSTAGCARSSAAWRRDRRSLCGPLIGGPLPLGARPRGAASADRVRINFRDRDGFNRGGHEPPRSVSGLPRRRWAFWRESATSGGWRRQVWPG